MIELQSGEGYWRRKIITHNLEPSLIGKMIDDTMHVLSAARAELAGFIAEDYATLGGPGATVMLTAPYKIGTPITKYVYNQGTTVMALEYQGSASWGGSAYSQKELAYESVPRFIKQIDDIIQLNNLFLKKMNAGKLSKNAYFITAENGTNKTQVVRRTPNYTTVELVAYAVPFQSQCSHCRTIVNTKQLPSHMKTARCVNYRTYTIVEGTDNKRVDRNNDRDLYNLCNDGLVDTELVAYRYDAYVPNWIYNAYQIWKKNDRGFAGMSLYDYLQKMKPESEIGREPKVNIHMHKRKRDPR